MGSRLEVYADIPPNDILVSMDYHEEIVLDRSSPSKLESQSGGSQSHPSNRGNAPSSSHPHPGRIAIPPPQLTFPIYPGYSHALQQQHPHPHSPIHQHPHSPIHQYPMHSPIHTHPHPLSIQHQHQHQQHQHQHQHAMAYSQHPLSSPYIYSPYNMTPVSTLPPSIQTGGTPTGVDSLPQDMRTPSGQPQHPMQVLSGRPGLGLPPITPSMPPFSFIPPSSMGAMSPGVRGGGMVNMGGLNVISGNLSAGSLTTPTGPQYLSPGVPAFTAQWEAHTVAVDMQNRGMAPMQAQLAVQSQGQSGEYFPFFPPSHMQGSQQQTSAYSSSLTIEEEAGTWTADSSPEDESDHTTTSPLRPQSPAQTELRARRPSSSTSDGEGDLHSDSVSVFTGDGDGERDLSSVGTSVDDHSSSAQHTLRWPSTAPSLHHAQTYPETRQGTLSAEEGLVSRTQSGPATITRASLQKCERQLRGRLFPLHRRQLLRLIRYQNRLRLLRLRRSLKKHVLTQRLIQLSERPSLLVSQEGSRSHRRFLPKKEAD